MAPLAIKELRSAVKEITNAHNKNKILHRKWLTLDTLEAALRQRFDFGEWCTLSKYSLAKAVKGLARPCLEEFAHSTVFTCKHSYHDKVLDETGKETTKIKLITYYWFCGLTRNKNVPRDPETADAWESIRESQSSFIEDITKPQQQRAKRCRTSSATDEIILDYKSMHSANQSQSPSASNQADFLQKPRNVALFNPIPGESVRDTLEKRVAMLRDAIKVPGKLEALVESDMTKKLPPLSAKQAIQLLEKVMGLMKAYEFALSHMNPIDEKDGWTWTQCCESATNTQLVRGTGYAVGEIRIIAV